MTAYTPTYTDVETPDDLIEAIRTSLEYWLMVHTDPETWAEQWLPDGASFLAKEYIEHGISNDYFSFDVKVHALTAYLKDIYDQTSWYKCPECGMICEAGFEECDDDDIDPGEWEECDEEEVLEWLNDIYYNADGLDPEQLTTYVYNALLTEGFKTYRNALETITEPIEEQCQEAIEEIDNAETNQDRLVAAMAAAAILHVNGEILTDYGENTGLTYQQLDTIRSEGLTALFDPDELREWINA